MGSIALAFTPRYAVFTLSVIAAITFLILSFVYTGFVILFIVAVVLVGIGVHDVMQKHSSILRNYPIAAHIRFLLEEIRPEIRQYFLESDTDGSPFNREQRSVVYQRAKGQLDKRPFGTQLNVYDTAFEWLHHSIVARHPSEEPFRVSIGGPDCKQPYSASIFNISAMSFGSLSANAIRALNTGAKKGGFYHDTGEGGFSPYHKENGGDIVWEIGSGYFGCRNPDGTFSEERFRETVATPQI
ncbi:MAG: FMN-binding glutamate synthase family protein, partial [Alphaproteobacteria bacterium]|nr:FMN-binding glutamate synthase family protein [Alphaproteobacteria bacterium]